MSDRNDKPSESMKKKTWIYTIILVLITVAAIIAGVVIYAVPAVKTIGSKLTGISKGIDIGDIKVDVGGVKVEAGDAKVNIGNVEVGSGSVRSGSWEPAAGETIGKISVDADLINLRLVSGDKFSAEWDVGDSISDVELKTVDGELKIRKRGATGITLSLGGWDLDKLKSDLTVTVPADICLEELEIELDCGNVVIKGAKSRKTEIDAACGNIELKDAELGQLEVKADCGNVEMEQVKSGDAEVKAALGRVAVLEGSFDTLTVKADCGQIDCRRIKADRVELDADCGSIEASGDFGSLTADCDLGSITVDTDRPEGEVKLDLNTSVGAVTVNGKTR